VIQVVCWYWPPRARYRSQFGPKHVNVFRNMIERHLHVPHEVCCITDSPKGIDERVRIIPLWDTWNEIPSPHGGLSPACYRRLPAFGEHMREIIGPRFVSMDLDLVITDDITPIIDRPDVDFMIWGSSLRRTPYNGSMWMMNAGARKEVYEKFDPEVSPKVTLKAGFHGSDQAWISYLLGHNEKRWDQKDGIFSFRTDVAHNRFKLPEGARIVFFQGHHDPQNRPDLSRAPWIKEHYR
jgi:hypothetical protein